MRTGGTTARSNRPSGPSGIQLGADHTGQKAGGRKVKNRMDAGSKMTRIRQAKIVAILRRMPAEAVVSIAEALVAGGIRAIEVTFGSEATTDVLGRLRERLPQDHLIGAGTVMTREQVDQAIAAGAEFLLSPHFDPELVDYARDRGTLFVPGVATPTEIAGAMAHGCALVKLFPAGSWGSAYLKDLKGPFREMEFLPTGGVGPANGRAFFDAGAYALGMGSLLVPHALVQRRDFAGLTEHAASVLQAVSNSSGLG